MKMDSVKIVKIGGAVLDDDQLLEQFISGFLKIEGLKVLVHGGGRLANRLSEAMGLEIKIVNGRRITDEATLQIAVMAYAGWSNKLLVARLKAAGLIAIGFSGADLNWLKVVKRPVKEIDFGWVGDVVKADISTVHLILNQGWLPVISCIGADENGQLLNINADTIATELAIGFQSAGIEVSLLFCFEKEGILDTESQVIKALDINDFERLQQAGVLSGGILPKIENALSASRKGVSKVWVGSYLCPGRDGTLITH